MGLARSFETSDQLTELLDHGAVVGTADFISPEQAMGDPKVDIRTDIYSLGATFYSLVTGRPPFDGPTASKLIQHQMKPAPSLTLLDKTIPKELAAVVARMMAKKPGDRHQTPADVIVALHPWLHDAAPLRAGLSQTREASVGKLSSKHLSLGSAHRPKPSKKPTWIWILAGILAAVVLLGIGLGVALAFGGGDYGDRGKGQPTPATRTSGTPATLSAMKSPP
jgi:serine/threonine protein kinase